MMAPPRWRRVTRLSARGLPVELWEREVPQVPSSMIRSVFYLYRNAEDAMAGERQGGTGFVVGVPIPDGPPGRGVPYLVTVAHVIEGGAVVPRVNRFDGRLDTLPLTRDNWIPHPDGEDLAVAPLPAGSVHFYEMSGVQLSMFLEPHEIGEDAERYYGAGDECVMIGRYVGLDGTNWNTPVVRFGNISRSWGDPITQHGRGGFAQESILVEMRSLSGFSGSPVFTYKTGSFKMDPVDREGIILSPDPHQRLRFLGVDWGHFHKKDDVVSGRTKERAPGGDYVVGNSGMAMVVPAWKLRDLLDLPELVALRKQEEKALKKEAADDLVEMDSVAAEEYGAFERLAEKLVQVPKDEIDAEREKD